MVKHACVCVCARAVCVLQLSDKSQRVISLEVELTGAKAAAERASANLASSAAEKGRLQVEALSLAKLRDSA